MFAVEVTDWLMRDKERREALEMYKEEIERWFISRNGKNISWKIFNEFEGI